MQEVDEGEGESEGPAPGDEDEDHAAALATALPPSDDDNDDDFDDDDEAQVSAAMPVVHAALRGTVWFHHDLSGWMFGRLCKFVRLPLQCCCNATGLHYPCQKQTKASHDMSGMTALCSWNISIS